jgi:hypothetical protein
MIIRRIGLSSSETAEKLGSSGSLTFCTAVDIMARWLAFVAQFKAITGISHPTKFFIMNL